MPRSWLWIKRSRFGQTRLLEPIKLISEVANFLVRPGMLLSTSHLSSRKRFSLKSFSFKKQCYTLVKTLTLLLIISTKDWSQNQRISELSNDELRNKWSWYNSVSGNNLRNFGHLGFLENCRFHWPNWLKSHAMPIWISI